MSVTQIYVEFVKGINSHVEVISNREERAVSIFWSL